MERDCHAMAHTRDVVASADCQLHYDGMPATCAYHDGRGENDTADRRRGAVVA